MIATSSRACRFGILFLLIGSIACGEVVVTTVSDENNGSLDPGLGSGTSLREAVLHAPDGSVIGFSPALNGQTLVLALGQISIGKNLSINASPLAAGLTVSGNHASRVFSVSSSKTVTLTALDLIDGDASGDGGAILNAGNLTLIDCELSGNSAGDGGGAIENSGTLTLTACTLAGNTADVGGGAIEHASGTLTATNCTFSGNTADFGGAIDGDGSSTIRLYSCTLSGNHATNDGGGIEETTGTLLLENTIVAGNTAADEGPDLKSSGINTQSGVNLLSSTSGLGGSFGGIVASPNLAALAENGGHTRTMLPLAGSPAINAGGTTALTTDQRGLTRVVGAAVDIGAVEVQAASIVTTTANAGPGSLRDIIAAAPAGATVTFAPALDGQTIALTSPVVVTRLLVIDGSERLNLAISGGDLSGIFTVDSGISVELRGLTLRDGDRTSGGAIHNSGTLALHNCNIRESHSDESGGGIFNAPGALLEVTDCEIEDNQADTEGGGVFNGGTATFTRSSLSGNNSSSGGGILSTGSLSLFDSVVSFNDAGSRGAGIESRGSLVMERCTAEENWAEEEGGAIHNAGTLTLRDCSLRENWSLISGGGIHNASGAVLEVTDCEIADNQADIDGGGIFNEQCAVLEVTDSEIAGNGAETAGGGVFNGGTATFTRSSLSGNYGSNGYDGGSGGGILSTGSLSLFDSVVRSNGAFEGGGGIVSRGTLVMERCTVEDNDTGVDGDGGGLVVAGGGGTITACTIAGNHCQYGGGGIFHWAGTLAVVSSTLSGNSTDYEHGAGLYTTASAVLTSCTIAGNDAGDEGGGVYVGTSGHLSLTNSIIAGNLAFSSGPDLRGAIETQAGVNLVGSIDGIDGPFTGLVAPPQLGPLSDNGGPTWTMLPLAGSPAIDAGGATTLATDQRGLPRVVGAKVDIGAVETQGNEVNMQTPSRPLQLTITAKTATTVSLSWSASTDDVGVEAYDIFIDGHLAGSSPSNVFSMSGLEQNRSYTFRVKARDGSGNLSQPSNALLATPQAGGLLAPPEPVRTEFRALVLNYNPSVYVSGALVPSDTFYGNRDVGDLTDQYIDLLKKASGGQVNWSVTNRFDLNEWPAPEGSPSPLFNATNSVTLVSQGYHYPASYQAIIHDPRFDIDGRINRGELDAVWVFGPLGIDFSETAMVGPTAYYINGRTIVDPSLNSNIVVYGFGKSSHQGVGFMCENTAHMTEKILDTRLQPSWPKSVSTRTFNTLNLDNPARALVTNLVGDWTHFVQAEASSWDPNYVAPGGSQCGLSHYPPTSLYNYNWNTPVYEFDSAGPFKTYDGTWQSVGGEYRVLSGDGVKVLAIDSINLSDNLGSYKPAESFSDADVELSIRVVNGTTPSHAGFLFRVSECAAGPNQVKGYYLGLSPSQDQLILAKLDHAFIPLASAPVALDANVSYRLRLEARGSRIEAFLGDSLTPLLSHDDSSYITGGFGLTTYGTEAYFDKLSLVTHVTSTSDKWYGYPDLVVPARDLSPLEWDGETGGVWSAMDGYYAWWWEHLPKNGGGHYANDLVTGQPSLLLNTWWPYVFDHNRFNVTRPFPDIVFPPEDVTPPSTPFGLAAIGLSGSTLAVSWNPASDDVGVTRYAIYRDGEFLRKTARPYLLDTRLAPGVSHTYEIMACDGSGNLSATASIVGSSLGSGSAGVVINGGFEVVPPDASGWTADAFRPADARFTWEPEGSGRNGSRSASITATGYNDARWIQTVNGLVPGARYWLTGWIKGECIVPEPGRSYGANLSLFSPAVSTPGNLTGTFDWQRASLSFVAPGSGSVTVACRIGYFGNVVTGKALFDDIAVVRHVEPRLVEPQVLSDGRFRFVLQAPQPTRYVLQRSNNLSTWSYVRDIQVIHPETEIFENFNPPGPWFYRAVGD
jgi:hypothetical protein